VMREAVGGAGNLTAAGRMAWRSLCPRALDGLDLARVEKPRFAALVGFPDSLACLRWCGRPKSNRHGPWEGTPG
jgi:hypothetical protein